MVAGLSLLCWLSTVTCSLGRSGRVWATCGCRQLHKTNSMHFTDCTSQVRKYCACTHTHTCMQSSSVTRHARCGEMGQWERKLSNSMSPPATQRVPEFTTYTDNNVLSYLMQSDSGLSQDGSFFSSHLPLRVTWPTCFGYCINLCTISCALTSLLLLMASVSSYSHNSARKDKKGTPITVTIPRR